MYVLSHLILFLLLLLAVYPRLPGRVSFGTLLGSALFPSLHCLSL
jgi:hypothetical protein